MWILFAFGSALFAGITSVLAKVGIEDTDSNLVTALRTLVIVPFAWLMAFLVGSQAQIAQISPRSLTFLILSGLATGFSWLCYFRALQLGDVNKVVPIDKSSTVLTMLLAILLLGEPFSYLKGLCMALIALGTYLMIERRGGAQARTAGGGRWMLYALGSALFAALTSILGKVGIEGVESNLGTAIRCLVVLLMAWLVVFLTGKQRQIPAIKSKSWLFILLSGLATGLSWLCFYRALQEGPASVVVPIDKLSILVSIGAAALWFKERLTRRALAGLALIVAGTLMLLI